MFLCAALLTPSCKEKAPKPEIDYETTPVQSVRGMQVQEFQKADLSMEMRTRAMDTYRYEKDSVPTTKEVYSEGFEVYLYSEDGLLESQLVAEGAQHITTKKKEEWMAFGNVNILNHIKGERIITDTVYWDRQAEQIYTDCYVVMTSPQGKLQGYGMRSDQRANKSTILRPFDSYGRVVNDSTKFYIDTVNFVGPLPRNK
ncbi:MAG: LPS export ABC transporter periplasmic protein LptC [Bacteroidales bacterium]|nr:LPS export ABC transporter periplasmic protein LptC [Bacteroidales bacterium]